MRSSLLVTQTWSRLVNPCRPVGTKLGVDFCDAFPWTFFTGSVRILKSAKRRGKPQDGDAPGGGEGGCSNHGKHLGAVARQSPTFSELNRRVSGQNPDLLATIFVKYLVFRKLCVNPGLSRAAAFCFLLFAFCCTI